MIPNDLNFESYVPSKPGEHSRHKRNSSHHSFQPKAEELSEAVAQMQDDVDSFQHGIQEKIFASTVFSATMLSAFRREYICDNDNVQAHELYTNNGQPIQWLRLKEVGLPMNFRDEDYAHTLELFLQAFHAPGKYRQFFLVSSDAKQIHIYLGFQATSYDDDGSDSFIQFVNNFAVANWPGLAFERVDGESFSHPMEQFVTPISSTNAKTHYKAGVRALTGIPALRHENSMHGIGSLDRMTNALRGKQWCYMVISEPVHNTDIDQIIYQCRDFAGRAESLRSFQIGKSINETLNRTFSQSSSRTTGTSRTAHEGSEGVNRVLDGLSTTAKFLPLAVGVLAITCPALIPLAAPVLPKLIFAGGAGALASAGFAALKGKAYNTSESDSLATSISESLSETHGMTFGENIVNKHAAAMAALLDEHIKRYSLSESLGAWNVGVYFVGEDENTADIGANILKSLQSGENSYLEPIRIHNLKPRHGLFEKGLDPIKALMSFEQPQYRCTSDGVEFEHPLGYHFNGLTTLVNTRELCNFINVPLSHTPGVSVRRISPDTGLCLMPSDAKIRLGAQVFRGAECPHYPYAMSPDVLAKHTLVCGINGSGKTTTILGILDKLLLRLHIPFLVIEPAKQEYVEWAIQCNERLTTLLGSVEAARKDKRWINVYIPGRTAWNKQSLEKLSLNPFDFVWLNPDAEPKTLEHIDRLKTIVNAALPMQEILPVMMEELIYMAYSVKHAPRGDNAQYPCWLPKSPDERFPELDEHVHIPNFQELARLIPSLFKKRTYAQDVSLNLKAALETRIDSFKRGWRKELLNKDYPRHTREDWERLFEHPTVINLTSLTSDEDKAFFMSIILLFIYEYRQELSEMPKSALVASADSKLKHLLVVEEAHRVLSKCDAASSFSAAPKQKLSAMFSNMISEVRAYGQGIMVADQIPGRLNEDAIKNTNLKIVHKLVSNDDRRAMSVALNLWDDQERMIGELGVGEVLVRGDMDKEAYMVKVDKN